MVEQFSYNNGFLYVENISANDIYQMQKEMEPLYIFSKNKIVSNVAEYKRELDKQTFRSTINYSMKANANPAILKLLKDHGCSLTLVSGLELTLALELGFPPKEIVFNGNGKQKWEIDLAIQNGVLLNIDSLFNLEQTIASTKRLNLPARILLRVNPNMGVDVHQYVSTGKIGSKFGLDEMEFNKVLSVLRTSKELQLVGLHCHIGSTIDNLDAIAEGTERLTGIFRQLKDDGFNDLTYVNIGGGLGIPYRKLQLETLSWQSLADVMKDNLENLFQEYTTDIEFQSAVRLFKENIISGKTFIDTVTRMHKGKNSNISTQLEKCINTQSVVPTPSDLIRKIKCYISDDVHLIIEPGRSLVGNAAILLCNVLGCKQSGDRNFIVVNAAMTEVIRPCLYGAYHHIDMAVPTKTNERKTYDVVGPVCESSDFLGKSRFLQTPHEDCLLAVFDVGAYCGSMSMTYNMRRRPAEVMVDGSNVEIIRSGDTYEDLMRPYRV